MKSTLVSERPAESHAGDVLLLPIAAYAQAPPAVGGMTLLQAIQASVAGWAGPMRTAAQELLGALGVISLVFAVGCAYMNGDGVRTRASSSARRLAGRSAASRRRWESRRRR